MRIIHDWPPNIDEIRTHFDINGKTVFFAWGDDIFNPSGKVIEKQYIVHETIHMKQQSDFGGPVKWWRAYIDDPQFRVSQEIPAYGAQLAYVRATYGSAEAQRVLDFVAKALSGSTYGNAIGRGAAKRAIMRASL